MYSHSQELKVELRSDVDSEVNKGNNRIYVNRVDKNEHVKNIQILILCFGNLSLTEFGAGDS